MKPTFIILLFSFIATCSTFAQQSSNYVSGRVTDTNGEPLPGATISIKGKGTGAVTTSDGTYTLQLPGTGVYHYRLLRRLSNSRKEIHNGRKQKTKFPSIRRSI